jgi:hypothetical protein
VLCAPFFYLLPFILTNCWGAATDRYHFFFSELCRNCWTPTRKTFSLENVPFFLVCRFLVTDRTPFDHDGPIYKYRPVETFTPRRRWCQMKIKPKGNFR